MAGFSRLPNEMILKIWDNILEPGDVESFALASKNVYALGKPFVEEHNRLKKEFSFFATALGTRASAPAFLLEEVLRQPHVALYVTHFCIDDFQSNWQDPYDDDDDGCDVGWPNERHVSYPDDTMALFIETIQKTSFVPPNEVSRWITSLKAGDEDPILALLALFLPNVKTMTVMEDVGYRMELFLKTILRIAAADKTMFFTRLTTVNVVFEINEDAGMDLACLKAFATLPFVQSIHVRQMGESNFNYSSRTQYFEPDSYRLTEMTFTNSGLHPKLLFQLLESMPGLKRLSYEEPDEEFCPFEPFWLRAALLATAKHTLEFLKILPSRPWYGDSLGTLRAFTALKKLDTDPRVLNESIEYDKLVHLLPASLEKFSLDTRHKSIFNSTPSLIEHIVRKVKSHLLPNLKSLKLRVEPDGEVPGEIVKNGSVTQEEKESMIEKCHEVGIELTIIAM